jgi:hypothetical protein
MSGLRPARSIWPVVIATALLATCRRATDVNVPPVVVPSPAESRAERRAAAGRRIAESRARERAWFLGLPTCLLPPLGDTTGWRPTYPGGVKLPATFAVDSAASVGFLHGGHVWRDGERTYTQSSGHWGYSSFLPDTVSFHCRIQFGNDTILFNVRESSNRYQASAWVVDTMPKTLFTTLHKATGPRSERLFVLRVLQTRPLPIR